MRTFYRGLSRDTPLKGIFLYKNKKELKSLAYIKTLGFVVIPTCIYLYTWYVPKNLWDALRMTFNNKKL